MAHLPDVSIEPDQLAATFEAFSGPNKADPIEEYRRWVVSALRDECIRRRRDALMAEANRNVSDQLREYAATLMPDLETPVQPPEPRASA